MDVAGKADGGGDCSGSNSTLPVFGILVQKSKNCQHSYRLAYN